MNEARRKEIRSLETRLETLKNGLLFQVQQELEAIAEGYETVKDEEQESFDNLPESLQQGENGSAMEESVSALEEVGSLLDEHKEALTAFVDAAEEIISKSDEAKGSQ